MIKILIAVIALSLFPLQANAETPLPPTEPPILVVDKCPEFCPPPDIWKKKMCTMALIPVPKKKHWYWTDGCKTKMVYMPPSKKRNR